MHLFNAHGRHFWFAKIVQIFAVLCESCLSLDEVIYLSGNGLIIPIVHLVNEW